MGSWAYIWLKCPARFYLSKSVNTINIQDTEVKEFPLKCWQLCGMWLHFYWCPSHRAKQVFLLTSRGRDRITHFLLPSIHSCWLAATLSSPDILYLYTVHWWKSQHETRQTHFISSWPRSLLLSKCINGVVIIIIIDFIEEWFSQRQVTVESFVYAAAAAV